MNQKFSLIKHKKCLLNVTCKGTNLLMFFHFLFLFVEIQNQTNTRLYKIDGYNLIVSNTIESGKSRLCCYIKSELKYTVNKIKNNTIEIFENA